MILLLAKLAAILALQAQPSIPAPEFVQPLLANCAPVVRIGEFVGCENRDDSQDETDYAGIIWQCQDIGTALVVDESGDTAESAPAGETCQPALSVGP